MRSSGKNIELKTGKVVISYNDQGPANAPVIIFIHGFPLNKSMWQKQEDALMNDYRVIAYDVRGHGKSQLGDEDACIDLFADDLVHFMDMLAVEKATVCGLSMGGYIALRAMEKYPERFEALVLCDTQCVADTPEGKEKRMKTIDFIRSNGKEAFATQNVKNLFRPESFETMKHETGNVIQMALDMNADAICSALLALANRDETCSRLDEIHVPTLVLVGKDDKLTPPERSQFMSERIKGAEMHIIDRASHASNIENPADFNNYLKTFLDRSLTPNPSPRERGTHEL